jgi:excisionase family DNA binding protein
LKDQSMTDITVAPTEPLAVGITDAIRLSGVGRSTIFDEIKAGRLKARKAGRRTLILRDDLKAWLNSFPLVKAAA